MWTLFQLFEGNKDDVTSLTSSPSQLYLLFDKIRTSTPLPYWNVVSWTVFLQHYRCMGRWALARSTVTTFFRYVYTSVYTVYAHVYVYVIWRQCLQMIRRVEALHTKLVNCSWWWLFVTYVSVFTFDSKSYHIFHLNHSMCDLWSFVFFV